MKALGSSLLQLSSLNRATRPMVFSLLFILSYGFAAGVRADVTVSGFSPSAGWAGTDLRNGTLVTISGSGFDLDRDSNQVLFSNNVAAKVLHALPKDQDYILQETIGQSGSQDGGLSDPWDVAIDESGNVYVGNYLNRRIEVFDKEGNFIRNNFEGLLAPTQIAVDNARQRIIVIDSEIFGSISGLRMLAYPMAGGAPVAEISLGSGDPEGNPGTPITFGIAVNESTGDVYYQNLKFNSNLEFQGALDLPLGSTSVVSIAFQQSTNTLFVLDNNRKVLLYEGDTFSSELLLTDTSGVPGAIVGNPRAIDVDFKGDIYVSANTDGQTRPISKFDGMTGKLIAQFGIANEVATGIAVDSNAKLYGAMPLSSCECIKVFAPSGSERLLVAVPPGAVDGLIRVTTSEGSGTSDEVFKVFQDLEPVTLDKFEVTQGLATNPLVRGKETLMYLRFNGRFGHPGQDSVTFQVTDWEGKPLLVGFPRGWDDISYDNNQTIVTRHIGSIPDPGDHHFSVSARRGDTVIGEDSATRRVYMLRDFPLLFVKWDVLEEEGSPRQPFGWFDTRTFLSGIEHLKRVLPVEPDELTYRFHEALRSTLVEEAETVNGRARIRGETLNIRNHYVEKKAFKPEKAVGLVDKALRLENDNTEGWGGTPSDSAGTFFEADNEAVGRYGWVKTLAHETGHMLGQIPKGKKNYIDFKVEGGNNHSSNITLANEKGSPIAAWNPITDKLYSAGMARSIMTWNSAPNDYIFFESQYSDADGDEDLEYRTILRRRSPRPDFQALSSNRVSGEKQYVIIGTITDDAQVTVDTSYVREYAEEPTPTVRSDLELVFLDNTEQALSKDGFIPELPVDDTADASPGKLFSLVRPLPEGTAKIEIRLLDRVLKTIVPSNNAPTVSDVRVTTREFGPYTIEWSAGDVDGDALDYAVYYSANGGQTYIPIAVGLKDTQLRWNHSVHGGSSDAAIEVVAGDGFFRSSALSAPFSVPTKSPVVSILTPRDGERILEGHVIQLRGAAYDPEDGVLLGDSMTWEFDGSELASENVVRIGERTSLTPSGPVQLPVEVGSHVIALTVTDSSGNAVRKEIEIIVVEDTDRDGKSDADEIALGSDPYDPSVFPSICGDGDLDVGEQCDDGNQFSGDGCDALCKLENANPFAQCQDLVVATDPGVCLVALENASVDNGSLDPNGDSITLSQVPSGPYPLGTTNVTLTVTDDRGGSASCTATITVVDQEAPIALCNAPGAITPRDAPISFPASANDNCQANSVITAYDCFMVTKKGKRIDKTESCVVEFEADTLTILDSGGVGDNITWVSEATDSSGNQATENCAVTVIRP